MKSFKKFYEKKVLGLIEKIFIHGVGDVEAKLDSGNSGYCVISATNITIQGNNVTFSTINNQKLSEKIIDTISINIGGGHVEERPVVNLRIKMGDVEYDNIPFSLSDRSTNDHPVLISKDFIIKDLDALIDPSRDDIADKQIEVEMS